MVGAAELVIGLYMQYWHGLALVAAANLGIADEVGEAPQDIDTLAARLHLHPQALLRLMRALSSKGIFRQTGAREFAGNRLSAALRTGAPGGARELIRCLGLPSARSAAAVYEQVIRTGQSAAQLAGGAVGMFEHLAATPTELEIYDGAMTAAAAAEADSLATALDFSRYPTLVDIGGGHGTLLATILARNPGQRGCLLELPRALPGARAVFDRYGVANRCALHGGDFRTDIPSGGDGYILKNVLHGYDDDQCRALLARIRAHAAANAHVFIIERLMPATALPNPHTGFDLFLLLGGIHSRVRTESEYRHLLREAGYGSVAMTTTGGPSSVIDAT